MDTKDISEEQYRLLNNIREKAQEAGSLGEVAAEKKHQNAAQKVEAWIQNGMAGQCPVDPADYDLGSVQQETEAQPPDDQPREATLEKWLAGVAKAFEKGEIVEARFLLFEQLEARPGLENYPQLNERVKDLKFQIDSTITTETSRILKAADEASATGDFKKAFSLYQEVLRLDPGNELATAGKSGVLGKLTPTMTAAEENNLIAALRNRKDLTRLGEAIDKAEVLVAEGRAPERVIEQMPEATAEYEEMRKRDGALTTMMRMDDLEARIEAHDKIEEKIAIGHKKIFNPITGQDQDVSDMLKEANALVSEAQEEAAEHELRRAKEHMPEHPEWAVRRLEKALVRQLANEHKKKLESRLSDAEKQAALKQEAEAMVAEAADADDETESYGLHLQAKAIFPHIPSVKTALGFLARVAESEIVDLIEQKASAARRKLDEVDLIQSQQEQVVREGYESARSLAGDARKAAARWPEQKNPKRIDVCLKSVKELDAEIDARQKLRNEFEAEAAAVRDKLADSDRRASGFKALDALIAEKRFDEIVAKGQLRSEADQYKDIGATVHEVDAEAGQGNWERVYELCVKVLKRSTGAMAPSLRAHRDQARTQLDMQSLKELLRHGRDEIGQAEDLYRKIVKRAPEKVTELQEERAELDKCLAAADMERLYADAMRWKDASQRRSRALVALRHIGNLDQSRQEWELPPFQRCRHTADARREARELTKNIRDDKLPPVMRVYKEMRV